MVIGYGRGGWMGINSLFPEGILKNVGENPPGGPSLPHHQHSFF